jgi:oligopeptide/dipeptide ABC transporter ATP-binding protein
MARRVMVIYAGRVAETAPVEALFDAPAHPYSQALLASIPTLAPRGSRLATIEGAVPAVDRMPQGCRFAPRCPLRRPPCEAAPPRARPLNVDHSVACIAAFGYDADGVGAPAMAR